MDWKESIGTMFVSSGTASFISILVNYFFSEKSKQNQRILDAKKAAYTKALQYINEVQTDRAPVDSQKTAIIGAQLEIWASKEIIDIYYALDKVWFKLAGVKETNNSSIPLVSSDTSKDVQDSGRLAKEFIRLVRIDMGIKD